MQFTRSPRLPPVAHRLGGVQIRGKWVRDVILVALVGETNVTIAGGVYIGVMVANGEESGTLLS